MKIAIHSNQFDGRGTGKVPLDYALGLKNLLGHDVIFISSNLSKNEGVPFLRQHFPVFLYDKKVGQNAGGEVADSINAIIEREGVDFIQMLKAGENDGVAIKGCKSGVHCIFNMREPHGDVYASVSEHLAKKYGSNLFVPHIIKNFPPTKNLRSEWGIPQDALVYGRHGGADTFDLPYVHQAIHQFLHERKDVYFVFLSTNKFIEHERVIFLPWVGDQQEIFNFVHSCDAMIHGRNAGETFGLAVGEFSVANKPVLTNANGYDTAHIDHLGDRALLYTNKSELMDLFRAIDRSYCLDNDWDVFSEKFSEKSVTEQYRKVFLT
jgi:hypothetical protein